MATPTNRLAHETSPYLLQHAHNPVDWYPWGDEALARAKREDKPILLSIGYAACHWCHVMERESFEDATLAAQMNAHFVCIKVDREERPDLDEIYMAATVAMTGHGGWPMTVFLTPTQEPFFAGTYFPPESRYGRPGFGDLLARIVEVWEGDRDGVEKQAAALAGAVREQLGSAAPAPVSRALIEAAAAQLAEAYDPTYGGFGRAPKFPPCPALRLLLRHHAATGDERTLQLVRGTLDGMRRGGIRDHVGGGFARYSTDARWHVPHFEKMLYDNAQLARVYIEAYQVTADPAYAEVARETLDYALREMQSPSGAFYSATDADSEGVEGKFFTFTAAELHEILGEARARTFCAYYDVRTPGNWEHTNVLWTPRAIDEVAAELELSVAALRDELRAARSVVYEARAQRVPPLLDDKVLVSWNALMIGALAEGARVLDEPRYRHAAERVADDLGARCTRPDGGLYRTARGDTAHLPAYLEDYAYLGLALLELYESGARDEYAHRARALGARMLRDFADDEGGFYTTARDHEQLIARSRTAQDDALPNAQAIAGELCARLSFHFAEPSLRAVAEHTLARFGALLPRAPRAFASALSLLDLLSSGPVEIAIIGSPDDPRVGELARAVHRVFLPNRILAHSGGDASLPLLEGKTGGGAPAVYICRDFVCEAPLASPDAVERALRARVGLTSPRSSA